MDGHFSNVTVKPSQTAIKVGEHLYIIEQQGQGQSRIQERQGGGGRGGRETKIFNMSGLSHSSVVVQDTPSQKR